jgi:hypothetical protein
LTGARQAVLPLFGEPRGFLEAIYRKRMAFVLVAGRPEYFRRDFMSWLSVNWRVWEAFEVEADKVWARGRRRYSARTIGEYLRHESMLCEVPTAAGWKLNDHYWPDLGRLWFLFHPDRDGFFERRVGPSTLRAA